MKVFDGLRLEFSLAPQKRTEIHKHPIRINHLLYGWGSKGISCLPVSEMRHLIHQVFIIYHKLSAAILPEFS